MIIKAYFCLTSFYNKFCTVRSRKRKLYASNIYEKPINIIFGFMFMYS